MVNKLKKYRFDELYDMSSGISSKPEQAGHGFPFVSFSTIFNNVFLPNELDELMNTSIKERQIYSVKKGDIFLTRTSETLDELGMSSVALKDYPDATFSGFSKRLRPKEEGLVDSKFIGFYLRSYLFRKAMNNNAIMTLRASFNEQIFSYLELLLPTFEVQCKIGELLYNIYEKIEVCNSLINQIENMSMSIFDYWFIQFDFPNISIKPYKTSGGEMFYSKELNRKIPDGWKTITLGDFCEIYQPKTISQKVMDANASYLVYGSNGIIGKYSKFNHEDSEVVVSCRGACGNIHRTRPKSWITGNSMVFKIKNKNINNEFIYHSLRWLNLKNSSTGSVQGQLTRTNVSVHNIVLPDEKIIKKYNNIVAPLVEKKLLLFAEIDKYQNLLDWLTPLLINGQVTFKEAQKHINQAAEPQEDYG
ncbi:restriction endonuclease subunit S [Flavivirga spongiicola]|uniref:Restriction endonuclease subunit S n=1 Tax=Flavivirga spongiicola TaxID=421621 RepID=A0ABU7Y1B5_9FLAO|nr:restriction endonuclease subunit S [Flavivirga sp. MEBiC05379]MDO5980929.1 restriction endonuclease subunit S [Flavivirga sp. MEBiC05379]